MVTIETETQETQGDTEEGKMKSHEDDPDPDPEPAPGHQHQQHCVGNAAVARNNPRLRWLFTLEEEEEEVDSFEDYYIMDTQRNV